MRVLVVEDDKALGWFLQKRLEAEHYVVDVIANSGDTQRAVEEFDYDLVILDLCLPGADGLEVLKQVQAGKTFVPVLVLSSSCKLEDRVKALNLGADDFMAKPLAFSEVAARARSLLRRAYPAPATSVHIEDLEINRVERTVKRGEKRIDLSPKEYALLDYFARHNGKPVTRAMITEGVWNLSGDTVTNVVDVYVSYLRKKIDGGCERKLIHTIRGTGYRLGPAAGREERGEALNELAA